MGTCSGQIAHYFQVITLFHVHLSLKHDVAANKHLYLIINLSSVVHRKNQATMHIKPPYFVKKMLREFGNFYGSKSHEHPVT